MHTTEEELKHDLELIRHIPFLPQLLDAVCLATGMGFAAMVRVTTERWVVGAVKDNAQFGLVAGVELPLAATICNEMRETKKPVIIDYVAHDVRYCNHPTLSQFGLQSYISFPILLKDDSFFGSLLAVDANPAIINTPAVTTLFTMFSSLIAAYLDGKNYLSAENVSKLERYAIAELTNARKDMAAADEAPLSAAEALHYTNRLNLRLKLLMIALNPEGAFLK